MSATRRSFLLGALALAAAGRRTVAEATEAAVQPVAAGPLLELSAQQAVAAMQRGELSAERYATALLARCAEAHSLNAFISLEPAKVLEAARAADRRRAAGAALGALHGLPVPVKDSINTLEYPTTAGTPALRNFRPVVDAPIVAALRQAGAIVLGKTNLHELSYGWTSNNLAFGAVHNPYDPTRIPGGSSGGTAAAIAAQLAPLGIAADTEGSIRVPAALCGIAGFRPTTGRYSTEGAVPITPLFDQVGPHARWVADLGLFDAVATGDHRPLAARSLAGVRLAVARGYWYQGLDPEVERLTAEALGKLTAAGAKLVEAEVPDLAMLIDQVTEQVQNHDVRTALSRYLQAYGAKVTFAELIARASPDVRGVFEHDVLPGGPGFISEAIYRAAVDQHLPTLKRTLQRCFADTGAAALVFPATLVTAPRIGVEDEVLIRGQRIPFAVAIARNIAPGSTAGLPGLVLPAGIAADGLPVALEFDGPAGSDRALLELGLGIEAVLGPVPRPHI